MNDYELIVPISPSPVDGAIWTPTIGEETHRFLSQKPGDMRARLEQEGARVLGLCIRPGTTVGEHSRTAGLVLGYVQSGKTSSFTTVTALARDNHFKLVIVVAGTTELLQDQTIKRLTEDLALGEMDAWRRWITLKNPSLSNDNGTRLKEQLGQFASSNENQAELGTPLVVVMKQHVHLANLVALFETVHELDNIPTLIIDDEAHMHSPNVGKPGKPSTTYVQLKRLRGALPVHSLLQYTATPQAPLLANITDELSPEFVCLLEPGVGYTGGKYFFADHHDQFVRPIKIDELYALDAEQFSEQGPPRSLRKAFITFLLDCAVMRFQGEFAHRTMLVHPDSKKVVQSAWFHSIESMKLEFQGLLNASGDPDFDEWVDDELTPVWIDLKSTFVDLPALTNLIPQLKSVLSLLMVKKVNSSGPAEVQWNLGPYWVLVGGNLLGVGFTVEGLCVTHMMRATGLKLADTIQQRARFFGYKMEYGWSCRAWIQPDLDAAFVDYVRHEKAIRDSLADFEDGVAPLKEWKRVFLLDPRFKLTRKAAHRLTMDTFTLKDDWCIQRWYQTEERELFLENRQVAEDLIGELNFQSDSEISGDTDATRHDSATCSPDELRGFLARLRFPTDDSPKFNALNFLLAQIADEWNELMDECLVINIAARSPQRRTRGVKWEVDGNLRTGEVTLHQGRNPRTGEIRYQGDNKARRKDRVTLQIHNLDLLDGANGPALAGGENMPFVAVYVPEKLQAAVWIQK